jgi:hypothetical protein
VPPQAATLTAAATAKPARRTLLIIVRVLPVLCGGKSKRSRDYARNLASDINVQRKRAGPERTDPRLERKIRALTAR